MEHKKTTREKKTWKLGVHGHEESSGKAMKINVELRLNVDEQQDDKTFKGKSYIDDSEEITATRTVCDEYSYSYSYSQISVWIFIFVFIFTLFCHPEYIRIRIRPSLSTLIYSYLYSS